MHDQIPIFRNGQIEYADIKKVNGDITEFSIQNRALPEDERNSVAGMFPSSFSFGHRNQIDESLLPPWWSEARDIALRGFVYRTNNDILIGAISSMVKKFKAMNWKIEGPLRVVNRYQRVLTSAEFWQGWSFWLGKILFDYLTQDKGAFSEIIGAGDPRGPIVGPVLGVAHLDSRQCQLTGDIEFPVIFHNPKTKKGHKLHTTRVAHFVDMPSPAENMYNTGFCAVSRVIGSSEILIKINKYKNEKLDDLPEAGLLIFNNVLPDRWNDAKANYARETRRLGQEHWRNVMTLFGLDPAQAATADLISFSNLPEAFNELESTNTYINILALAFGVDTREFWPLSGGNLGTATESEVMHQKARGKGVGEVISMIERILNWKVLPESATFFFDFQDDQEDLLGADIDEKRTNTIMSMWQPDGLGPVSRFEIRQMLADNVSYFPDDFLEFDATEEEDATDTELAKAFGGLATVDQNGNIKRIQRRQRIKPMVEDAVSLAAKNYRNGMITAEKVAEFALGELIDAG
ncbi:MAG: hypothetical protein ACYSWP_12095 [Planctomycetota bacterium]|jgi:hypothetical protein